MVRNGVRWRMLSVKSTLHFFLRKTTRLHFLASPEGGQPCNLALANSQGN